MQGAGWYERSRRLMNMSWEELWLRSRQEVSKRADLLLYRGGRMQVKPSRRWDAHERGRFFFTSEEIPAIVACLRERLPESLNAILEQAEQICEHRFDLLGYKGLHYGSEIDWHLDAVNGKRAPRRPWFQLRYLNFLEVGDAKVIWELNRHQHLVTLAKAYRITQDPHFALELFRQWYHWQEQNPYPIGVNWASSLEVAFRTFSWLWVWHLLEGSPIVPFRFSEDLNRALMLNARHIERYLSTYFSPNTHLIGEAAGLFFIGTLCAGLRSARRLQTRGWQTLLNAAHAQVQPDGMYFEQSSYYHTYALDFFLHCRILAALNNVSVPSGLDETIKKMLDVLCALGSTGPLPRLGDDDGGRLFDARRNRTEHLLDPLATGAALFGRADYKHTAVRLREETLWLLGITGSTRFDQVEDQPRTPKSMALKSSGIYVMSSRTKAAHQLVIDAGPQGAGRSGHAHADALSVQLAVHGQLLLVDPGTFVYADLENQRNRFRGTGCHNTVLIDGLDQADTAGPFGWQRLPNVAAEFWRTGATFDLFVGSHDGYTRLENPVRHRRSIFYLRPSFWFVRDVFQGLGIHRFDVSWQFAPGSVSTIPEGATFSNGRNADLTLLFASDQSYSLAISQGWHSPAYGIKESSPVLGFSTKGRLPTEMCTVLIPAPACNAAPGRVKRLLGRDDCGVRAYCYQWGNQSTYLFFADEGRRWQFGPWSSDARFLAFSNISGQDSDQIVICDGSYLILDGRRILGGHSHFSSRELVLKRRNTLLSPQEFAVEYVPSF